MRLRLKLISLGNIITKDIAVDEETSLLEFRNRICELFPISNLKDRLCLSLNNKDYRLCQGSSTLLNEGFVNGDIVYLSTEAVPSSQHSTPSSAASKIQTSTPLSAASPSTSKAEISRENSPSRTDVNQLKRKIDSLGLGNSAEIIVALIHQILLDYEFKEVQFSSGLPTDWRRQLSTKHLLRLTYGHRFCGRSFNLSFQVLCNKPLLSSSTTSADVQLIGLLLTGLCVNVDESVFLLDFSVFFNEFDYNDYDKLRQFVILVKKEFIQQFVSNLIGYQTESRLLHLPADILLKLAEQLPFNSFFNLCRVCSKTWNDLYEDDTIWRMLLRRDFRDTSKYDCYRDRYVELYVLSRRARTSRSESKSQRGPAKVLEIPNERPVPDDRVYPLQGIIGGPDDAHPPLHPPPFPAPRPLFPQPSMRPRFFPRHPATQPERHPRPGGPGFGGL